MSPLLSRRSEAAKRSRCRSRAASTRARMAVDGSPMRSSASFSNGSKSRVHPGHLDVDVG